MIVVRRARDTVPQTRFLSATGNDGMGTGTGLGLLKKPCGFTTVVVWRGDKIDKERVPRKVSS